MYRCILAPVDGTGFGEAALPYAAAIAGRAGATLHIAHVHESAFAPVGLETVAYQGAWNQTLKEQESEYLRGLAERIGGAFPVPVETRVIEGPVAASLERYALECGAGLLVMSSHGHTGLSRLWHHCVAEQVARDLPLPVLLVHSEEEADPDLGARPEPRRVLVPLDGSAGAEAALEHAVALGRLFGARFTLLRVLVRLGGLASRIAGDQHQAHHQRVREQAAARQYLNSVAERLRAQRLEVDTHVEVGEDVGRAVAALVEASRSAEPIALVAMPFDLRSGVSRVLSGGATDAVLKHARVPVLVVRQAHATVSRPATEPMPSTR